VWCLSQDTSQRLPLQLAPVDGEVIAAYTVRETSPPMNLLLDSQALTLSSLSAEEDKPPAALL